MTECILLRLFFNLQGFYDVLRVLIADARSFQDLAISCWLKHLALISCWTINPKPNKMSLDYLKLLYREFQKYKVTLIDALPAWGCLITGGNSVRNSRIWLWIFGRIVLAPYSSFGDACQQGIMLWLSTWRKWQIQYVHDCKLLSEVDLQLMSQGFLLHFDSTLKSDYDKEYRH